MKPPGKVVPLRPPSFDEPPQIHDHGPVSRPRRLPRPRVDGGSEAPPLHPSVAVYYAELHCLSDFSFQRGASSAAELFERAARLGYNALAITDECSLAGIVRAWEASKKFDLRLIVGSEIRLADGPTLVFLVEDLAGYTELCRLVTLGRRRCEKGSYRLCRADVENLAPGLVVLWLPDPAGLPSRQPAPDAQAVTAALADDADWVRRHFAGRAWIAVELHRGADDAADEAALVQLGKHSHLPVLAAGGVHMHHRSRRVLQDVLTAVRLNTTVANAGDALFPNGERHLRQIATLCAIHSPALLAETQVVADRCRFRLDGINYEYPHELVPQGRDATTHLRELTWQGARAHWPDGIPDRVVRQLDKELALIRHKKYEHFFLTVYELVDWARRQDPPILCQGRGSAANSAVCYCLGITSVDPATGHLLFERFLSADRDEPPDIDVDFEHERREEVLQHVFSKYGRDRAALAATVITWQSKSAVRAVGAAMGLGADQLDALSRVFTRGNGGESLDALLAENGFDSRDPTLQRIMAVTAELVDRPRHLSQHVGGFVISEHPLHSLVPVENAAMADRTVIQWDKDDLEALGLLKVDCLALGMLTCLRKCFDLIQVHKGEKLGLKSIAPDDQATYEMIQKADTIGVFQIESRAQMSMLPRLRPATFYDLVIEVAIVRPGPIQGGMVHPYLRRRSGEEHYVPDERLAPAIGRTLGVPIFQEQVMHLLQLAADFTPEESDKLRRSMAAWKRHGGLEHFEQRIRDGMRRNHYDDAFATQIFEQIKGFGSYGFPESHATSFAQIAYVSSWLKCHHPEAFTCALINSQPMGFYPPAQLIQDLRHHGGCVRPADVSHSDWDCTLEALPGGGHALRLGLRLVKSLKQVVAERIVTARRVRPFADVADFTARAQIERFERDRLAEAGALKSLAGHRHRARWESAGAQIPTPLLSGATVQEERVALRPPTRTANVMADYATTGLSLEAHPAALARAALRRRAVRDSRELQALDGNTFARSAGLVTVRQAPPTASGVVFVTLEDEHGQVNVVVWRDLAQRQRRVLLESVLLGVDGVLQTEQGVRHLVAKRLHNYTSLLPAGLDSQVRNFY
ncbi:error-prone DNA polymerase [Tahibacter amnicola]|uniref:Error-prone DNA polymerase n=1 Tax=Tahibacter amnicola TaxID=2976241 RepID=A0ABY6BK44_9GAMM|nr:error-prone DNA polymerase [Tahibacter amnicola]UXI68755.1 error-prone DNA polymerase [Tahibacter amnicola]